LSVAVGSGISAAKRAVVKRLAESPWSRLEQIEVVGIERLPEHDILQALAVEPGSNLMHLQFDALCTRVNAIPAVRRTRVLRRLPGRLVVRVEERRPVAAIARDGLILIDEEGVTFPPVYAAEVIDLPIITGDVKSMAKDGFRAARQLIVDIERNYPNLYRHLSEVSIGRDRLLLRLREGGAAVKAAEIPGRETLASMELFLEQRAGELTPKTEYIDLRYPAMVVTGTR